MDCVSSVIAFGVSGLDDGAPAPLPPRDTVVRVASDVREHRQRDDVVDDLAIALENGLKVLLYTGLLGDPLKQPYISVQAVPVFAVVGRPARLTQPREYLGLAHVPFFGEDEHGALFWCGHEELGTWHELQVVVDGPPVDVAVLLFLVSGSM